MRQRPSSQPMFTRSQTPNHRSALAGVALVALLGCAVLFISFLVAPLAILTVFCVGFAASDRAA
jgi:hypothetical protein